MSVSDPEEKIEWGADSEPRKNERVPSSVQNTVHITYSEQVKQHIIWENHSRPTVIQSISRFGSFRPLKRIEGRRYHEDIFLSLSSSIGRIQRKTWWLGPYAGVDLTLCDVHWVVSNTLTMGNSVPVSTLSPGQGLRIWPLKGFGDRGSFFSCEQREWARLLGSLHWYDYKFVIY
jgi:hypothetical protein